MKLAKYILKYTNGYSGYVGSNGVTDYSDLAIHFHSEKNALKWLENNVGISIFFEAGKLIISTDPNLS